MYLTLLLNPDRAGRKLVHILSLFSQQYTVYFFPILRIFTLLFLFSGFLLLINRIIKKNGNINLPGYINRITILTEILPIGAFTYLALIIRLYNRGAQPYWWDEMLTA